MQFISCHSGKLQMLGERRLDERKHRFSFGLAEVDALLPGGFARGSVHELLMPTAPDLHPGLRPLPRFVGLLLAKRAVEERNDGAIVWCDREHQVYPPAIAAAGIDLRKLYLLHPESDTDEHWSTVECLRCKGVGAMIAAPKRMSHVEARRLQLAAEAGGGVGILLRSNDRYASIYAAASRWLIEPAQGERTVQRWKMQLLSGHGGRTGKVIYLECYRETHHVRALEQLANRPAAAPSAFAFG